MYEPVPLDTVLERMRFAAGDTLDILEAVELPPVKQSRLMTESSYRIHAWPAAALPHLEKACADLLSRSEIVIERGAPGKRRTMDIRPYLLQVEYRADELARLLAESVAPDVPDTDARDLLIEKTGMVLE
jgi:hypothetical protein